MLLTLKDAKFVTDARRDPSALTKEEKEKALNLDAMSMRTTEEHLFSKEVLNALSKP